MRKSAAIVVAGVIAELLFGLIRGVPLIAQAWGQSVNPTLFSIDYNFSAYNAGNLAAATAFGRTQITNASTLTADSTITVDVVGVGAGSFVVKLCSDGTTCGAGNIYLTCTDSVCTNAAGTITACSVTQSAVPAGTTLTWSVTTACATTDPGVNLNAHFTIP